VDDEGYDTAEEAARGDIPERYARILRIDYSPDRTRAVALLATNEPPAIEYYEVHCEIEGWPLVRRRQQRERTERGVALVCVKRAGEACGRAAAGYGEGVLNNLRRRPGGLLDLLALVVAG
jgi:hypothetical protein